MRDCTSSASSSGSNKRPENATIPATGSSRRGPHEATSWCLGKIRTGTPVLAVNPHPPSAHQERRLGLLPPAACHGCFPLRLIHQSMGLETIDSQTGCPHSFQGHRGRQIMYRADGPPMDRPIPIDPHHLRHSRAKTQRQSVCHQIGIFASCG